jgi:hypothetical protein
MNRTQHLVSFCALAVSALCLQPACTRRGRDDGSAQPAPAQPAPAQPAPTPPAVQPAAQPTKPQTNPTAAGQPTPTQTPTDPTPTPITLQRSIVVGRWPEGLSAQGDEAWVAESGGRSISHVDLTTGALRGRVPSGRLPIRVHASGDGSVQAVSATDRTVWSLSPGAAAATVLARLPEYPQDAVWGEDGMLWALLWQQGSSASALIVRVAPGDGAVTRVATVGAGAMSLAVGHGKVWVAHQTGTVSVVDMTTGQALPAVSIEGSRMRVAACANGVYVTDNDGVSRIDPTTSAVSGRQSLDDGARTLACAANTGLWVVGAHGHISRLDPQSLAVINAASPPTAFEPVAAQVVSGRLLVTTHAFGGSDASGALLVFNAP